MTTIVLDYDLMNQVVQIAGHSTPQEAAIEHTLNTIGEYDGCNTIS